MFYSPAIFLYVAMLFDMIYIFSAPFVFAALSIILHSSMFIGISLLLTKLSKSGPTIYIDIFVAGYDTNTCVSF